MSGSTRVCAVFSGGGIKGAALAGAMRELRANRVTIVGYGGSSAGAIVALLGALGLDDDEVRRALLSMQASDVLPNQSAYDELELLISDAKRVASWRGWSLLSPSPYRLWAAGKRVVRDEGLYESEGLLKLLATYVQRAFPRHDDPLSLTFRELEASQRVKLRVVVADISTKRAIVLPRGDQEPFSVVRAVAASAGYPALFRPAKDGGSRRFVDGGLASNLPVFLFQDLFEQEHIPTFAFDLVPEAGASPQPNFARDVTETALGAHNALMSERLPGVFYCPVHHDPEIETLNFALSDKDKAALYDRGARAAREYLATVEAFQHMGHDALSLQRFLRRMYGEHSVIESVLAGLVMQVEALTPATEVRASVMLPTGRGTRIVVYATGFQGAADADMELNFDEGLSGHAHTTGDVAWVDFGSNALPAALIRNQARVPQKVRGMMSLPIFASKEAPQAVVGTLNLDTTSALDATRWREEPVIRMIADWTWVLRALFKPWRSP